MKPPRSHKRWTKTDDTLLRLASHRVRMGLIADQLGRSTNACFMRAVELGIPARKGKPSRDYYLKILAEECLVANVPMHLAASPRRFRRVARVRWNAWARLRQDNYSLPGIGLVAGVDHTTVLHGLRRAAQLSATAARGEGV